MRVEELRDIHHALILKRLSHLKGPRSPSRFTVECLSGCGRTSVLSSTHMPETYMCPQCDARRYRKKIKGEIKVKHPTAPRCPVWWTDWDAVRYRRGLVFPTWPVKGHVTLSNFGLPSSCVAVLDKCDPPPVHFFPEAHS